MTIYFICKEFSYGLCRFDPIHHGHVQVHEDQIVSSLRLVPSLFDKSYCLTAIISTIYLDVKLLDLRNQGHAAECIIFNDQNIRSLVWATFIINLRIDVIFNLSILKSVLIFLEEILDQPLLRLCVHLRILSLVSSLILVKD